MIFKDRQEAAEKLSEALKKLPEIKKNGKRVLVISLLRGGIVLGKTIAKRLNIQHLPLAVAKIPAPDNAELAIGALCFEVVYLEPQIVSELNLDQSTIQNQILIARKKFASYIKRFSLQEKILDKKLKNKIVILTDDGIATGSSMRAAALFIKSKRPKKIILCVPVAPTDFEEKGFDQTIIIHKDPYLGSVSQFYEDFPQVEDAEVKKLLNTKS